MANKPVILWFRRDLRLHDNPALNHAAETGRPILPVFILDDHYDRPIGAASKWWLDKSLRALDAALTDRGARLILRRGGSLAALQALIAETGADAVFLNRLFEPGAFEQDAEIAHALKADGVECRGFNGTLMCRPGAVLNGSGNPYKVFTPFLKTLLSMSEPPPHTTGPRRIKTPDQIASDDLDDWGLHPMSPDWSGGFDWTPGETARWRRCRPSSPTAWRPMQRTGTSPTAPPPAAFPRICTGARSVRGAPSNALARRPRTARSRPPRPKSSSPRSAGASSRPICCTSFPTSSIAPSAPNTTPCPGATIPRVFKPGDAAEPAIRWWTPGCASCGPPAGCTIGCA